MADDYGMVRYAIVTTIDGPAIEDGAEVEITLHARVHGDRLIVRDWKGPIRRAFDEEDRRG